MEFKMSNKAYNVCRWIGQIVFPAVITLYGLIAHTLALPRTEDVMTILVGINVCFNTILGISTANYNASKNVEKTTQK